MKLTFLGGGSSCLPEIIDGLIKRSNKIPVDDLFLMDVDEERLDILGGLTKRMLKKAGLETEVSLTTDGKEAIEGSDFIISLVRVGFMQGRILDEKISIRHGVIGQETTGAGGLSNALRTVPVMVEYAKTVERWAPDAFFLNFTNPSGIVVEAMTKYSKAKVIGICNSNFYGVVQIAEILNVDRTKLYYDFVGLNHLNWIRHIFLNGEDLLPNFLNSLTELFSGFNAELLKNIKMVPSGYLRYYFYPDRMFEKMKHAKETRGEVVDRLVKRSLEAFKDPSVNERPKILDERMGTLGMAELSLSVLQAILHDENTPHLVHVPNKGALKDLKDDQVIEVNAVVNREGAHLKDVGSLPPEIRGLVQCIKAYEELAIEAAMKGSRDIALKALLLHPLVPSYDVAKPLLDDLLEAHREYLPNFFK